MHGHILLPVTGAGELWYVNPKDNKRYLLANAEVAFSLLSAWAVTVTDKDIAGLPGASEQSPSTAKRAAAQKRAGTLVMSAMDRSKVWFISPKDLRRYYFDGSESSWRFFHYVATGVSADDLARIPVGSTK